MVKITEKNNDIIIMGQTDFDLTHIFECGQCFRFDKDETGAYIGTAYGKTVKISKQDEAVTLHQTSMADFNDIWHSFLDLDRDYSQIKYELTKNGDPVMRAAVNCGSGIRILRQDLWETIISFIISASNNIPRIKKIISLLCTNFGDEHEYMGNIYHSFPSPEKIASLDISDLSVIRAGFRDKYILSCARDIVSGKIDLERIKNSLTPDAKSLLMNVSGIGNKVSDCILLFGLNRFNSFPVDVWIKRVMEFCYFSSEEQSIRTISDFAAERFGDLGGIAQQYLFFYARENKIGTEKN